MATAAFVMIMSAAFSNSQQKRAAGKVRRAQEQLAEQNAVMAEEDSEENLRQMRLDQGRSLGMAKAQAAASGIKFDSSQINDVQFTEGGQRREYYDGSDQQRLNNEGAAANALDDNAVAFSANYGDYNRTEATTGRRFKTNEDEFGAQVSGSESGSSTFNYLRNMKQAFANDLGWQSKLGASRAKVARFGGTIAGVEYKASRARANAEMYSSFAKAYASS
jgi:hypothetical protein